MWWNHQIFVNKFYLIVNTNIGGKIENKPNVSGQVHSLLRLDDIEKWRLAKTRWENILVLWWTLIWYSSSGWIDRDTSHTYAFNGIHTCICVSKCIDRTSRILITKKLLLQKERKFPEKSSQVYSDLCRTQTNHGNLPDQVSTQKSGERYNFDLFSIYALSNMESNVL